MANPASLLEKAQEHHRQHDRAGASVEAPLQEKPKRDARRNQEKNSEPARGPQSPEPGELGVKLRPDGVAPRPDQGRQEQNEQYKGKRLHQRLAPIPNERVHDHNRRQKS